MEFIVVELESDFGFCQKSVAHDFSPILATLPPKEVILLLRYKICNPQASFHTVSAKWQSSRCIVHRFLTDHLVTSHMAKNTTVLIETITLIVQTVSN
jgi:hypothetical protein